MSLRENVFQELPPDTKCPTLTLHKRLHFMSIFTTSTILPMNTHENVNSKFNA